MKDDRIQIKGNKDGVTVNIDMEKFIGFDDLLEAVIKCLSVNKGFYKNSILKITSNFKHISDLEIGKLKDELYQNIHINSKVRLQKLRQMQHRGFQNYWKQHKVGAIEKIIKKSIIVMLNMVGIDMIQDLLFLYIMNRRRLKDIMFFMLR